MRPPPSRIVLATRPGDFRKGIDGLAAVCRQVLGAHPLNGAVFVFRNRAAPALKLRLYAGQGSWRCTTRLSKGRLQGCPGPAGARRPWAASALLVLLWNGLPEQARMAHDWRRLT